MECVVRYVVVAPEDQLLLSHDDAQKLSMEATRLWTVLLEYGLTTSELRY